MVVLLKALYRFNEISTRILMTIFTKQEKYPKKIHGNSRDQRWLNTLRIPGESVLRMCSEPGT